MSIIVIDGIIYDRLDTTANWEYVNPVLGNKEKGFEIDNAVDKNPVGMKIGDGILTWDDLKYWFIGSESPIIQSIPTNSDGHYDYAYDGSLGATPTAMLQIAISSPSAGWSTVGFADLLDNGHIYARADFSMDSYRLVVKG